MKKPKLYERTRWRFALIIIALVVVAASISYTNTVVYQLKLDEEKRVKLWFEAQQAMFDVTPEEDEFCDFELNLSIIANNSDIPMILTDEYYRIIDVMNYKDKNVLKDTAYFNAEIAYLSKKQKPILIENAIIKNFIFYKQSTLITSLEWFPYFQFALLGVLILLAYFTFSFNREAEQERVWVGMAKETAHQLGTPLSSLLGWIQNINMMYPEDEDLLMIAEEMSVDVELLRLVADRFSKIGTVPKLEPTNIYDNLNKHLLYVQQRASRKITFDFPDPEAQAALMVNISPLLFDWVVENLLKNALDASEGKGQIEARVTDGEYFVHIDISDTGKGIPKRSFKSVFQPGYSTKKRGWGLGLSLCKRVVEKYHNGKIFVLKSTEGNGTTFRIQLPQIKEPIESK